MRPSLGWAVLGLTSLAAAADLVQVRARGTLRVIVAAD